MLAFAVQAQAQAQVTESQSLSQQRQQTLFIARQEAVTQANAQLFSQLQQLQAEVMQMRGLLEEQAYQIRSLKQRRLEDYVNLDKRIAELAQVTSVENASIEKSTAVDSTGSATVTSNVSVNDPAALISTASDEDRAAYKVAYGLIKAKQFDQARNSFEQFLVAHPNNLYTPSAYYWLGELYILDANYEDASQVFARLLKQYPGHRKYPEALYEQAKINYELGRRDKAKEQLDEIVAKYKKSSSNTVRLAREFIHKHYP